MVMYYPRISRNIDSLLGCPALKNDEQVDRTKLECLGFMWFVCSLSSLEREREPKQPF